MKAKVGDIIVITNGKETGLSNVDNGKKATVVSYDKQNVYVECKELSDTRTQGTYYVRHDCYELAEVVNSPLWKALS